MWLLSAPIWLAACASKPLVAVRTETVAVPVTVPVPAELSRSHAVAPLPATGPLTLREIFEYLGRLEAAHERHEADKRALRALR